MTTPAAGRIVARDPTAIAEAVRALLADPPAREAVAASVDRFSWPAHAEAMDRIYSTVLGR
jgi:glycosyltransferase involved in cell wall biosynthesis